MAESFLTRSTGRLSAALVRTAGPGRYLDGNGLRLVVSPTGARTWVYRYMRLRKSRDMGLGAFPAVSLKEARELAAEARRILATGADPIEARELTRKESEAPTFATCAERYIEAHAPGWKNAKHAQQWRNTLQTYAYPGMGKLPVADVSLEHVLAILKPLWMEKTETASRLRGRIECVLDWATVQKYRTGENPARWRGRLDKLLPRRSRVAPVRHHPALPYAELPAFLSLLRAKDGVAAKALEFVILTATRTSEALNATWQEVDTESRIWTIPASRMKAKRAHRVPLSDEAVVLLESLTQTGDHVFPGMKYARSLSAMALLATMRKMGFGQYVPHGFRSSFRDWCAEQTGFPRELAEAALAHVLSDKTEAAYQRGDLFEKRRVLMQAWARYCQPGEQSAVVPLRRKA